MATDSCGRSKGKLTDLPPLSCNHLASGHLINWLLGPLAWVSLLQAAAWVMQLLVQHLGRGEALVTTPHEASGPAILGCRARGGAFSSWDSSGSSLCGGSTFSVAVRHSLLSPELTLRSSE